MCRRSASWTFWLDLLVGDAEVELEPLVFVADVLHLCPGFDDFLGQGTGMAAKETTGEFLMEQATLY